MNKYLINSLLIVLLNYPNIFGQSAEQIQYELLLTEARLFSQYHLPADEYNAYVDSAKSYAGVKLFGMAIIFLEEYISAMDNTKLERAPALPDIQLEAPVSISVKTGLDFNRQEFELGYSDADSMLLDEINKPYIGLQADIGLFNYAANELNLNVFSRYDKENWTSSIDLMWAHHQPNWNLQIQAGGIHDQNYAYPEFHFTDYNSRQLININVLPSLRFFLDNTLRWKFYQQPSQSIPSYFRNIFRSGFRNDSNNWGSFTANYLLDRNESIDSKNNDYTIHEGWLNYNHTIFQTSIFAEIGHRNNNYKYMLGDSLTSNIAVTSYQRLRMSYPSFGAVALIAELRTRFKSYQEKTEAEPDYNHLDISSSFKWILNRQLSIEPGYRYETKRHMTFTGAELSYIDEQNYFSNGFFLVLNYNNFSRWLFSMNIIYSLRRYPDGKGEDLFGIYNDRNILSLFLITQWNIGPNLDVNLFVSYDNDDDLDLEYNSARSSYYSVELVYRF